MGPHQRLAAPALSAGTRGRTARDAGPDVSMKRVILLADDSPTIRKVVELSFGDTTTRVETASRGDAAWRRYESLQPDLVLADAVMPDPDGYELCRRIKASARPVPVVLLSGTFEEYDRARAADCGADAHLRKPFESAALLDVVERLLVDAPPLAPRTAGDAVSAARRPDDAADDPDAPPPVDLDRLARAVASRLTDEVLREAVAELLPGIAERVVRERIAELERIEAGPKDDQHDDDAIDRNDPATPGAQ